MLITEDEDQEDKAIQLIEEALIAQQSDYRLFIGSDFPDDVSEEAAYRLIYDIMLCIERGISCILSNLSIIYQSFYHMLNQNY